MYQIDSDLCEEWDEWDLSPVPPLPRSILYSLKPIGLGTAWAESLTGYIARLADAHCVSPLRLLRKVIVRPEDHYKPCHKEGPGSESINSTGRRAQATIRSLELLTMRTDLRFLTLVPWSNVVGAMGALRQEKAWCPQCYEEWEVAPSQIIYDPLLWSFKEVSVCVRHQQYLHAHCPYEDCRRSFPPLAWKSRGYCSYCQRWLGRAKDKPPRTRNIPETPS